MDSSFSIPPVPMKLRVVAWLFNLSGLAALIEVIQAAARGNMNLNFGVLGLLVGWGLLRLRSGWRTFALVLLVLGFLTMPIALILIMSSHGGGTWKLLGFPLARGYEPLAVLFMCVAFGLSIWQYRVLRSVDIKQLFDAATLVRIRRGF